MTCFSTFPLSVTNEKIAEKTMCTSSFNYSVSFRKCPTVKVMFTLKGTKFGTSQTTKINGPLKEKQIWKKLNRVIYKIAEDT